MATKGFGALLKRAGSTIAEVQNFTGPSLALGTAESTHMGSTSGFREFIATVKDAGEITADISFLPVHATQSYAAGLIKDLYDGTSQTFTIVWTDSGATTWSFTAWVTRFVPTAPVDGRLTASVTLKLTGVPTLA
jgi:hypothetical protein